MSRLVTAAAITHGLIAVGHVLKGRETFALPAWRGLPSLLAAYAKVGWFQGGGFFALLGLYTYGLSQKGPGEWTSVDRMLLTGFTTIYWASSAWYFANGDKLTGGVTAFGGAMVATTLLQ